MSLSGIIIAEFRLPLIFKSSKLLMYFLKKSTRFLFLIFLADELRNLFGMLSLRSIL